MTQTHNSLGVSLLQQGAPELVFVWGAEVDKLVALSGQQVVYPHLLPLSVLPELQRERGSGVFVTVTVAYFHQLQKDHKRSVSYLYSKICHHSKIVIYIFIFNINTQKERNKKDLKLKLSFVTFLDYFKPHVCIGYSHNNCS